MRILNLTQHVATPEQVAAGVVEPQDKKQVQDLLTFLELPTSDEIYKKALELARFAFNNFEFSVEDDGLRYAMIGGAPYLMGTLEEVLDDYGIQPLYSFTERQSEDVPQPDGTIKKVSTFKHIGWVEV